jgi:uncharacterized protein
MRRTGRCRGSSTLTGKPLRSNIKAVPEVCMIYCAAANPLDVVVVQTDRGRGIVGVIDGSPPVGVEGADDVTARRVLLRDIGYKL